MLAGYEAECKVEVFCLLGNGVNDDSPDPDHFCCDSNALHDITEETAAQPLSLPMVIHSEAGQYGNRNRVRHIPPETTECAGYGNDSGSECIVAYDAAFSFTDYISPCRTSDLIAPRPAPEPIIERGFS